MSVIRVLIVDDEPMSRMAMRLALHRARDIVVAGELEDGEGIVAAARDTAADVVLLDMSMPLVGGVSATRALVEAGLDARVLMISGHHDAARVGSALAAGAAGYVSKTADPTRLPAAVRRVARGEACTVLGFEPDPPESPPVVTSLAAEGPGRACEALSPREFTVAKLVAAGSINREIADVLGISVKTVEGYRARAMEKLAVGSRAELVLKMRPKRRRRKKGLG